MNRRAFYIAVLAAFFGAGVLYWIFMPCQISGWDTIQFALGLHHFDLDLHQPHAPGYIGPMALAWLISRLGFSIDASLLLGSLVCAAGAVAAVLGLGWRLFGRSVGIMAAIFLATNPVAWSHAISGESYSAESLAAVLVIWFGLTIRRDSSLVKIAAFIGFLGLAGGIRQSVPLFLFPFALWRLIGACWGQSVSKWITKFAVAGVAGIVGILVWAIPLVLLVGGLDKLLAAFGGQFFDLYGKVYSPLMGAPLIGVLTNLDWMWRYLLAGLSVSGALAIILFPVSLRFPAKTKGHWPTFWLWITPPIMWFGLMFIAKPGHVLGIVPAFALFSAVVVDRIAQNRTTEADGNKDSPLLRWALVFAIALGQAALFISPHPWWTSTVGPHSLPALQRQTIDQERTIQGLKALADKDPDSVLIVCREGLFSYRQAMYHLPEFPVIWLMDSDSTGKAGNGLEACFSQHLKTQCMSGKGFWQWQEGDLPTSIEIPIGKSVRHIVWFFGWNSQFGQTLKSGAIPHRVVDLPPVSELVITDIGNDPIDLRIWGWRFFRQ